MLRRVLDDGIVFADDADVDVTLRPDEDQHHLTIEDEDGKASVPISETGRRKLINDLERNYEDEHR